MYTYDCDIACDMTLGELSLFCTEHKCHYRSLIHYGPAGGNPYIQFIFNNENDFQTFVEAYEQ